jgi:hypothetical protein
LNPNNPDDLRHMLDRFGNALPGAAEKLLARVAAGEAMTLADLRVDVWGPLGVDGSPAHATVPELLLWSHMVARPALATARAVGAWRSATADEGIPGFIPIQAARIARAALLWEAHKQKDDLARVALDERDTPRLLAEAWTRHAGIFLASDELAPVHVSVPHFQHDGQPGPWWALVDHATQLRLIFAGLGDQIPAFLRPLGPWLDERERELPKSTVDGVPWLSARLADYLRAELGEHGTERAAAWLKREREREAERNADELQIPGLPPRLAMAGWIVPVAVSGLEPGWGVSAAALALARAVWRAEVKPEVAARLDRETRTVAPGLPLSFAGARASIATRVTVDGDVVLSGTAPTGLTLAPGVDLATWQAVASTLHTLSARRAVAWLAWVAWRAHAEGDRGAGDDGWAALPQPDGSVLVTVAGGLSGLAAVLGIAGKDAGGEVFAALEALAGVVLSAQTRPEAGLTGAMVAQVRRRGGAPGRPGHVSCTLSPWWSPGAVHGLVQTSDRVIVPVLPPPPVDVLAPRQHTLGAALEERALIELATHAREVVTLGGVALRWHDLAPNLKPADVDRLVNDWRTRERWTLVGAGRWMLGNSEPSLAAAGDLIREGGGLREARARGGKANAAKKRGRPTKG